MQILLKVIWIHFGTRSETIIGDGDDRENHYPDSLLRQTDFSSLVAPFLSHLIWSIVFLSMPFSLFLLSSLSFACLIIDSRLFVTLVLSCLVLSCLVLSCLILSCLVLPYLTFLLYFHPCSALGCDIVLDRDQDHNDLDKCLLTLKGRNKDMIAEAEGEVDVKVGDYQLRYHVL